jgi:hypothetical protein
MLFVVGVLAGLALAGSGYSGVAFFDAAPVLYPPVVYAVPLYVY